MSPRPETTLLYLDKLIYPPKQPILDGIDLLIKRNELLLITGRNGSGKTLLGKILAGIQKTETLLLPDDFKCELISFDSQKEIIDSERRNDDSDFLQHQDFGTLVSRYLEGWQKNVLISELAEEIGLGSFINTGLRFLSTGEFRKVMILKALLETPELIILDNPLEGLDRESSKTILTLIPRLTEQSACLILCADPARFRLLDTNNFTLKKGKLYSGISEDSDKEKILTLPPYEPKTAASEKPLITMNDVYLSYYGKPVLSNINWTCQAGEIWHICGPNGSGKTSLLSLINGDNPRAYGCDISLFGQKKGSGESIWELRQPIGYMSPALQFDYRVETSVLTVLLSGFHDSIGLYEKPGLNEIKRAREWLKLLTMEQHEAVSFHSLSEGRQRIILIARAFIKSPRLLILDEPCQGLDGNSARKVLQIIDSLATHSECAILFVSHDPDHLPKSLTHRILLTPHETGGYTIKTEAITLPQEP